MMQQPAMVPAYISQIHLACIVLHTRRRCLLLLDMACACMDVLFVQRHAKGASHPHDQAVCSCMHHVKSRPVSASSSSYRDNKIAVPIRMHSAKTSVQCMASLKHGLTHGGYRVASPAEVLLPASAMEVRRDVPM